MVISTTTLRDRPLCYFLFVCFCSQSLLSWKNLCNQLFAPLQWQEANISQYISRFWMPHWALAAQSDLKKTWSTMALAQNCVLSRHRLHLFQGYIFHNELEYCKSASMHALKQVCLVSHFVRLAFVVFLLTGFYFCQAKLPPWVNEKCLEDIIFTLGTRLSVFFYIMFLHRNEVGKL